MLRKTASRPFLVIGNVIFLRMMKEIVLEAENCKPFALNYYEDSV